MRSQLEVVAGSPAEAVTWAGGLMYDRALDGWQVLVWLPEGVDPLALQILGAEIRHGVTEAAVAALGAPVIRIGMDPDGSGRMRTAQTYACESSVGSDVNGTGPNITPDAYGSAFHHRLSAAARAFKTYALRASGSDAAVEESETFRPTDQRWGIDTVDQASAAQVR